MHKWFNPGRFFRVADRLFPFIAALTGIAIVWGVMQGLLFSPPDYQQGEMVRVMYVHVPAAWMAMLIYTAIAGFSAASIIWKNPLADMLAYASAPIGTVFTFICLVTGSIWGKPTWGTWWVWDARLTSVLILFFFYMGYMAVWHAFDNSERSAKTAAILALVGFINIPIIKFSVDLWNTLHQPASILRKGGIAIDSAMLIPLLMMFVGFLGFYAMVMILRSKTLFNQRKGERLQQI